MAEVLNKGNSRAVASFRVGIGPESQGQEMWREKHICTKVSCDPRRVLSNCQHQ